jgi:hypothetical protein
MENKNRRAEKHGECLEISSHLRQMGEQFNGAMKGGKGVLLMWVECRQSQHDLVVFKQENFKLTTLLP